MNSLMADNFNLFHTLDSGQLFTFYKENEHFILLVNDAVFKLKQEGNILLYSGKKYSGDEVSEKDIKELFCLDEDQDFEVIDPFISMAKQKYSGLRIMKQLPYDATIAFMISQMNNIPRITQLSNELLKNASRKIVFEGNEYRLFPLPEELPSEEELRNLKFGYRAKYISNLRHAKELFEDIEKKDYEDAKKDLMSLMGVGSKVADCILLFSLKHYEAFPVDTHIIKFMKNAFKIQLEKKYDKKIDDINQKQIEDFGKEIYGKKAGIVQQYLFQYARHNL